MIKKLNILTICSIFLIPIACFFPTSQMADIWFMNWVSCLMLLLIGIGLVCWKFNKWIVTYYLYTLFSAFFVSVNDPRAVLLIVQFGLCLLMSYGISKFNKKQRENIIKAMVIFAALQAILMTLQQFNCDPFFDSIKGKGFDEVTGFCGGRDQLGLHIALTSMAGFSLNPLFGLLALPIVFSKSSFAFMGLIIPALFYCFMVYRKHFLKIIACVVVLGALFFFAFEHINSMDFMGRATVIDRSIKAITQKQLELNVYHQSGAVVGTSILKCNPWFGYGAGKFAVLFPKVPGNQYFNSGGLYNHAHNDYIELFFEGGYIGGALLIMVLLSFFARFILAKKTKEVIAYFCCCMVFLLFVLGNFGVSVATNGFLLVIFYGMFEGAINESKPQGSSELA